MNGRAKYGLTQLLVLLLFVSAAFAQQNEPTQSRPAFAQQELDQMLAPIALYPDALLSQILLASTYPLEVVEAARWSKANLNLTGDQAVQAAAENNWDPSVKSLVAFPQVLLMMDEKLSWTQRLGDAFLAQQAQVMDTVQNLRQKASAAGNLKTTDQVRVAQQGQTIVVESPTPEVVYVPYYDPMVVYGPWWWQAYPPVYWAPWPGYFARPGSGAVFTWGLGIQLRAGFFFGAFDWPQRHVNILTVNNYYYRNSVPHAWEHDPIHRRGVFYRDAVVRQQFRRTSASPEARREFRGHEPSVSEGRSGLGDRPDARGDSGRRPEEHSAQPGRSETHRAPSRPSEPRAAGPSHVEQRPHAFEGVGRGADVRGFSERGHASAPTAAPQSSGGGHGGGGGHNGGGGGKPRH